METDNVCFWYINLVFETMTLLSSGYPFIQICMTVINSSFMYVEMWSVFLLAIVLVICVPVSQSICCHLTPHLMFQHPGTAIHDQVGGGGCSSCSKRRTEQGCRVISIPSCRCCPPQTDQGQEGQGRSTCCRQKYVHCQCMLTACCVCVSCVFACLHVTLTIVSRKQSQTAKVSVNVALFSCMDHISYS